MNGDRPSCVMSMAVGALTGAVLALWLLLGGGP